MVPCSRGRDRASRTADYPEPPWHVHPPLPPPSHRQQVSPEGGGARTAFTREQLRHPSDWVVQSGRQRYAFAPPPGLAKLTTRLGRHFNCMEYPLSSRFAELAQLPHVGVKLEPDSIGSCLQSWNVTLVFDPAAGPPRLVAAVYDQWEW